MSNAEVTSPTPLQLKNCLRKQQPTNLRADGHEESTEEEHSRRNEEFRLKETTAGRRLRKAAMLGLPGQVGRCRGHAEYTTEKPSLYKILSRPTIYQ